MQRPDAAGAGTRPHGGPAGRRADPTRRCRPWHGPADRLTPVPAGAHG